MIFYRIICTPAQKFCYFSPSISHRFVWKIKKPFFILAPFLFFNCRVEVVMPSFSTLFSNSTWNRIVVNLVNCLRWKSIFGVRIYWQVWWDMHLLQESKSVFSLDYSGDYTWNSDLYQRSEIGFILQGVEVDLRYFWFWV